MAKLGSYPFIVDDLRARGEYAYALKTIEQWEYEFPTEKLDGLSFFWRGKVLYIWHPGDQAIRFLQMAELVNPAASHIPETVWLEANCYADTGRYAKAIEQFQRIRAEFTNSEYFERAAQRIKQCQAALAAPAGKGGKSK